MLFSHHLRNSHIGNILSFWVVLLILLQFNSWRFFLWWFGRNLSVRFLAFELIIHKSYALIIFWISPVCIWRQLHFGYIFNDWSTEYISCRVLVFHNRKWKRVITGHILNVDIISWCSKFRLWFEIFIKFSHGRFDDFVIYV